MPASADEFDRRIEAFYALGQRLWARYWEEYADGVPKPGDKFADKQLDREPGFGGPDILRKAMVFTDPDRGGYDRAALDALKVKVRRAAERVMKKPPPPSARKRANPRLRFGVAHVIRLLPVESKKLRKELLHDCLAQGWNVATLEAEVRRRTGRERGKGGRRPVVGTKPNDLANRLDRMCESWKRLAEHFDKLEGPDPLEELGPKARAAFDRAATAVAELRETLPSTPGPIETAAAKKRKA